MSLKILVVCLGLISSVAFAGDSDKKYHCELKKNGKTVDDSSIKTRKDCKAQKGKWVKEHDHDHGAEGHDHDHDHE